MTRRRYLSTEVSLDVVLNKVAERSPFAALFYSWMIPHAKDDATISGDPVRLLAEVLPLRRDLEVGDLIEALEILEDAGLFEAWDRAGQTIYFVPRTFYKYQTYIKPANRRTTPAPVRDQSPVSPVSTRRSPSRESEREGESERESEREREAAISGVPRRSSAKRGVPRRDAAEQIETGRDPVLAPGMTEDGLTVLEVRQQIRDGLLREA